MSKYTRPADRNDYTIALICALRIESDAVEAMFDDHWEDGPKYPKLKNDSNAYTTGRIGEHNVVLAHMAGIGKANSATLSSSFMIAFPGITLGLVVGICGGTPFIREFPREPRDIDVFLGDIIISTQVIQYDLGHRYSNQFVRTDTLENTLGRPNNEIRSFLQKMAGMTSRARLEDKMCGYLANISQKKGFEKSIYQGVEKDILYNSDYLHKHHESTDCDCAKSIDEACDKARELTCEDLRCSSGKSVRRARLQKVENNAANQANALNKGTKAPSPLVHFGAVASGDWVVKSAVHRDQLAESKEVIGFEMEGAGAWDNIPIVVIKSVVDYADSHKSYLWQKYGAACGAACMKAFVKEWSTIEKTGQQETGSSAHGLLRGQTGESSLVTREQSETELRLERPTVKERVDRAWDILGREKRKEEYLWQALRILSKAEVESTDLDSSLRQRIYWGLMTVEKELSCCKSFNKAEKRKHINEAQNHVIELAKILSRSSDASLDAQLSLEQHIIQGRKAILAFEEGGDVERLKRQKLEALDGIDASLKKLEEVDRKSYNKVLKAAKRWRRNFSC